MGDNICIVIDTQKTILFDHKNKGSADGHVL